MFRALLVAMLMLVSPFAAAQDVRTYIPPKAFPLLPVYNQEVQRLMPGFEFPFYFPALTEHESCISLKHSKCFDARSELKTAREWGVGLGQITVAYRADGSVRFDKLTEMRNQYNSELKELSWLTVKERPDLQIRAIVLMTRDSYKALFMVKDPLQRLKMADVAYNAGLGSVKKDRQLCGLRPGCDPQIWDGNVETNSQVSRKPIYGNRSAYDISRNHVKDTTVIRLPKYQKYFTEHFGERSAK